MELILKSGEVYTKEVEDASGSISAPLTKKQILEKARACCSSYERSWCDKIFQDIENMEGIGSMPSLLLGRGSVVQ